MAMDIKKLCFNFVIRDLLRHPDYVVSRVSEAQQRKQPTKASAAPKDQFMLMDKHVGIENVVRNNAQDIAQVALEKTQGQKKIAWMSLQQVGYGCVVGAALVCAIFTLGPIHVFYGAMCMTIVSSVLLSVIALGIWSIFQVEHEKNQFISQQQQIANRHQQLAMMRDMIEDAMLVPRSDSAKI